MTYNPLTDPNVAHPDIDEASIRLLIRTFYGKARKDELIGPIFTAAVQDWDKHIEKISDFWSSVTLRTRRYNGRPPAATSHASARKRALRSLVAALRGNGARTLPR